MVRQQYLWRIVRTGAINTENKGDFGMFSHLLLLEFLNPQMPENFSYNNGIL